MKTYGLQKRLAARALGVGKGKVWFDPSRLKEISDAITGADVEDLIKDGAIKRLPDAGVKRRAGKKRQERRRKRGKKSGRRKKNVGKKKEQYVNRIRKIRKKLKAMKEGGKISQEEYKRLRLAAKAGSIRTGKDVRQGEK